MLSIHYRPSHTTSLLFALCLPFAGTALGCGNNSPDEEAGGAGAGAGQGAGGNGAGNGGSTIIDGCVRTDQTLGSGEGFDPSVLWTGSEFNVTLIENGAVQLLVIDTEGNIVNDAQVSGGAGTQLPSLARVDDEQVAAVWTEGGNVLTRYIDGSAVMLTDPMVLAQTNSPEPRPSAAAVTGGALAVAWMEQPSTTIATVDNGQIVDSTVIDGWFPAVASRDGTAVVAWSDGDEAGPVALAFTDDVGNPALVPDSSSLIKAMVASEDDYFVAWEEVADAEPRVFIARFSASGAFVEKRQVSPGAESGNWPAVAWTGSQLAVAYYQFREGPPSVYFTFLDPQTLNPTKDEILIAEEGKYPSVAVGGSTIAIAYAIPGAPAELVLLTCED